MLAAVIPFGLVAGATPVAAGFGVAAALGMSLFMFAGASQLALTEVLADGGSFWVAAAAGLTINLRMLLYSASLAPFLAHEPLRRRLAAAYLTVDQTYALSVSRWTGDDRVPDASFHIGGGLLLGSAWLSSTAIGGLLGETLPEELPLDFAIPLVFLVLLIPILTNRPAVAATLAGGIAAVVAAESGFGPWSIIVGGVSGIAAGTVIDWLSTLGEGDTADTTSGSGAVDE